MLRWSALFARKRRDRMIRKIWWNNEYGTYEAIWDDGYIEPLRDSHEAEQLASKHNIVVEG
jgi:hypothetical protein